MGRIKMFGAIPRLKSLTPQEFHDHYRHPHGTIGRNISVLRGYSQAHQVDCPYLDERQTRFEACAENWYDSAADAAALAVEPLYLSDVQIDEPLFVDLPDLQWMFSDEEVLESGAGFTRLTTGEKMWRLDNRPTSVKITQFVEQDGPAPWAQDDDIALGERIGACRHVRCRPVTALHPDGCFAIGARELYWPTVTDMLRGIEADMATFRELIDRPAVHTTYAAVAERFI